MPRNMRKNDGIREFDLFSSEQRVPVGLCVDTSGSMRVTTGGTPTGEVVTIDGKRYQVVRGGTSRMDVLQKGLEKLFDTLYDNEQTRYAAELAIVTFDDTARLIKDFSRIEDNGKKQAVPQLETHDRTSLGAGVNLTLDCLEKRKIKYKKAGIEYYQPWIVIISDGEDNGSEEEFERAKSRIRALVAENKLSVYPFFIGTSEGADKLRELCNKEPEQIEKADIETMFEWIGKSVENIVDGFPVEPWDKSLN